MVKTPILPWLALMSMSSMMPTRSFEKKKKKRDKKGRMAAADLSRPEATDPTTAEAEVDIVEASVVPNLALDEAEMEVEKCFHDASHIDVSFFGPLATFRRQGNCGTKHKVSHVMCWLNGSLFQVHDPCLPKPS